MPEYDVTILTERSLYQPSEIDAYVSNVLLEDRLIAEAMEKLGLGVTRRSWDDPNFDWTSTRFALFRTTWDYFHRFPEFEAWLSRASKQTQFINHLDLVHWNMDKHYLADLEQKGINIPPTHFFEQGEERMLQEVITGLDYNSFILKPAIAGTARHTYRFVHSEAEQHEAIFRELLQNECMLIQEYQEQITTKGELSLMLFDGEYSHAVLKLAKSGDFRVQDDFGGTVHTHQATDDQISFAQKAVEACKPYKPLYARVDIFWDNDDELCLAELEMIEPELWFRMNDKAADMFAMKIKEYVRD